MGNRRKSRELAMQALFYMDICPGDWQDQLEAYVLNFSPPRNVLPFFRDLVKGVITSKKHIDAVIERFSSNWKMHRMPCVDRNVLRIAAFEMLLRPDIPVKVSINEAIDIGKKFGTHESGPFINGILDSIRLALEKGNIQMPPNQDTVRLERRCPRLGGPVPFSYCKSAGEDGLPCFKSLDCWWEYFDIQAYLENHLSEQDLQKFLNTRVQPKVASLLELIEKAKTGGKIDS
jgi:N utilization substance protein B